MQTDANDVPNVEFVATFNSANICYLFVIRGNFVFANLNCIWVLQIKPVRDSMLEALQHWKKIAGKEDGATDDQKAACLGKQGSMNFYMLL